MEETGLVHIVNELEKLRSRELRVHPHQCVRLRHRKTQCSLCADNCPTGAIIWGDSVQVNAQRCTDCGLCAAVCPTGVFEASNPSNTDLLQQINELGKTNSTIAFACPQVTGEDTCGVLRVTCLGRLDASILIGAAAAGIQQVDMVDCECSGCPNNIGHSVAEQAIAESNKILQACGSASKTAFTPWSDLFDQSAVKKKQPTSSGMKMSPDETPAASQPLHKGELPVHLPEKMELMLSSIRIFANQVVNPELDTNLWGTVSVNENCTGCQMCAFFCPTGALVKFVDDDKPSLAFKNAYCTNCRLCLETCYTSSIVLSAHVNLNKVMAQSSEILWSNNQASSYQEKTKRLRTFK
jgi:formate hydrogenlyase subunit 6/NADH:ubiquinone oxidoreductase subunit I